MPIRDRTTLTALEAWAVAPATRVWIGGNNTDARREIEQIAGQADRPPTGPLDRAFLSPATADEAVYFARKLRPRLTAEATLWIVLPKHGSSKEAQFIGSLDDFAVPLFELGFVEAGVATVGDDYSSLGFRIDPEQG